LLARRHIPNPSTGTEINVRLAEISQIKKEIEYFHARPGQETYPERDSSWNMWQYGKASNWVTLERAGGYAAQSKTYLSDMEWFNVWDNYYALEEEEVRLRRMLKDLR
jgi:hypothetical protein